MTGVSVSSCACMRPWWLVSTTRSRCFVSLSMTMPRAMMASYVFAASFVASGSSSVPAVRLRSISFVPYFSNSALVFSKSSCPSLSLKYGNRMRIFFPSPFRSRFCVSLIFIR